MLLWRASSIMLLDAKKLILFFKVRPVEKGPAWDALQIKLGEGIARPLVAPIPPGIDLIKRCQHGQTVRAEV